MVHYKKLSQSASVIVLKCFVAQVSLPIVPVWYKTVNTFYLKRHLMLYGFPWSKYSGYINYGEENKRPVRQVKRVKTSGQDA